jgi:methionine aminopeptidase
MKEISQYLQVQDIALRVLRDIAPFIQAGKTEGNVADECARLLEQSGARDCWYHNVPALVLVGERTTLSVPGTGYHPSEVAIRPNDLVTIDLSPTVNGCWGDCARSYIVESGRVGPPHQSSALGHGMIAEQQLHALMKEFVAPETSMHELYSFINQSIERLGYRNLDFRGNLGHSIEKHLDDRRYIEANNQVRLGDCDFFTFEPHICRTNDIWGFKMENIYYFEEDQAVPLGSPQLLEAVS